MLSENGSASVVFFNCLLKMRLFFFLTMENYGNFLFFKNFTSGKTGIFTNMVIFSYKYYMISQNYLLISLNKMMVSHIVIDLTALSSDFTVVNLNTFSRFDILSKLWHKLFLTFSVYSPVFMKRLSRYPDLDLCFTCHYLAFNPTLITATENFEETTIAPVRVP